MKTRLLQRIPAGGSKRHQGKRWGREGRQRGQDRGGKIALTRKNRFHPAEQNEIERSELPVVRDQERDCVQKKNEEKEAYLRRRVREEFGNPGERIQKKAEDNDCRSGRIRGAGQNARVAGKARGKASLVTEQVDITLTIKGQKLQREATNKAGQRNNDKLVPLTKNSTSFHTVEEQKARPRVHKNRKETPG